MSETSPSFTDQYAMIMEGMCRAVAARAARFPYLAPVLLILWIRLRRSVARIASVTRRAGQPARPRPATPAQPRAPRHRQRLPDNFAWVVVRVPEAAAYASQLQHLLTRPAMARLVEDTPQLGRILRPLCRMLGVSPPAPARPRPTPALQPSRPADQPSQAADMPEPVPLATSPA